MNIKYKILSSFVIICGFLVLSSVAAKTVEAAGWGWVYPVRLGSYSGCGVNSQIYGQTQHFQSPYSPVDAGQITLYIRNKSDGSLVATLNKINASDTSRYNCFNKDQHYIEAYVDGNGTYHGFYASFQDVASNHFNAVIMVELYVIPNGVAHSTNNVSPNGQLFGSSAVTFTGNVATTVNAWTGGVGCADRIYWFVAGGSPVNYGCTTGNFQATFNVPDGVHSWDFAAADNAPLDKVSGFSRDRNNSGFSTFYVDTNSPGSASASHSPASIFPTTTVFITGSGTDQIVNGFGSGIASIRIIVDGVDRGGCSYGGLLGNISQTCANVNVGTYSIGIHSYYAVVCDKTGRCVNSPVRTFTVLAPANNTLNVSSTPITGIPISGTYPGTTNYTQTSSSTMSGRIDAPATLVSGGNTYQFVSASGCRSSSGPDNSDRFCDVYVTGGVTQNVVFTYAALNTLNVSSTPVTGIPITGTYSGTTNYTRTSSSTMSGRIDAPATFVTGGITYSFVSASGCRNSSGSDNTDRFCDVYVTGGATQNVVFTYVAQNTLNVSSVPITGISISGIWGGNTNYTRTSTSTISGRIDAPATWVSGGNTYQFVSASGCRNSAGPDNSDRFCDVYVTGGATQNVVFTYVLLLPNLTVEAVIPSPAPFTVNDPITITTQIRNNRSVNIPFSSPFQTRLRARPISGVFAAFGGDRTNNGLNGNTAATWIWVDVYTPTIAGVHEFEVCTDVPWQTNGNIAEEIEGFDDNCEVRIITVEDSQPWLKTVGGNVGSKSSIDGGWSPGGCPGTIANCNATHMILATSTIQTFNSAKDWLVRPYSGGPSLNTYNQYSKFKEDFSAGACPRGAAPFALNTLPNAKGRFTYNTSVTWNGALDSTACSAFSSSKESAIVFINGNLTINTNLTTLTRPTVFIVSGNIIIASGVQTVNGMFVANGNFNTGSSATQLNINGSIAAALQGASSLTFGRTYKDAAKNASEIINFSPKYLYLLTDYVGEYKATYKETNP